MAIALLLRAKATASASYFSFLVNFLPYYCTTRATGAKIATQMRKVSGIVKLYENIFTIIKEMAVQKPKWRLENSFDTSLVSKDTKTHRNSR